MKAGLNQRTVGNQAVGQMLCQKPPTSSVLKSAALAPSSIYSTPAQSGDAPSQEPTGRSSAQSNQQPSVGAKSTRHISIGSFAERSFAVALLQEPPIGESVPSLIDSVDPEPPDPSSEDDDESDIRPFSSTSLSIPPFPSLTIRWIDQAFRYVRTFPTPHSPHFYQFTQINA